MPSTNADTERPAFKKSPPDEFVVQAQPDQNTDCCKSFGEYPAELLPNAIASWPSVEAVVPRAADQAVVSAATADQVVARATPDDIVSREGGDHVPAGSAHEFLPGSSADDGRPPAPAACAAVTAQVTNEHRSRR
jgi:hypothetical protein